MAVSSTKSSATGAARSQSLPEYVNGRYRLIQPLGAGGMGTVYLAHDLYRGKASVALKKVVKDDADPTTFNTLRKEFLVLSSLQHPGLANVYDFGVDRAAKLCFLTSEFVEGQDLVQATRDLDLCSGKDLQRFLEIVVQILRSLDYIHSRGLVHGDIKPANVLVKEVVVAIEGVPQVGVETKLIDFGLTMQEKQFSGRNIAGTPNYIAPEMISGYQIDRRTDLYSLGAVVYRLVTGEAPFRGPSAFAILKGHIEETPTPPIHRAPHVPRVLSDIILKLIEKDPVSRYQTVAEVIGALNELAERPFPIETPETARSYLNMPRLFAHGKYLRTLYKHFLKTCRIDPQRWLDRSLQEFGFAPRVRGSLQAQWIPQSEFHPTVLIRGEQGIGKSSFVRDLKGLVQTTGGRFLYVDCDESQASTERGMKMGMPALVRELKSLATSRRVYKEISELGAAAIQSEAPAGRELPAATQEAVQKLSRLLLVITRDQPALLHLDKLHACSTVIAHLLRLLVQAQDKRSISDSRLLVLGTLVDEEVVRHSPAEKCLAARMFRSRVLDIYLERLNRQEVAQLINCVFPGNDFSKRFLRQVAATSDGNPQVVVDVCAHLLDSGQIHRGATGWHVADDVDFDALPEQVRKGLKSSILDLDPAPLRLAMAFAYLGNGTSLKLARDFARLSGDGRSELEVLLESHVLRAEKDERRSKSALYSFIHTTSKEVIYSLVPEEKRASFHERAGVITQKFLHEQGQQDVVRLARHFILSRNVEAGTHFGMAAARLAKDEFRLEEALEIYLQVLDLNGEAEREFMESLRYEIYEVYIRMGMYRHAREELLWILKGRRGDSQSGELPLTKVLIDFAQIEIRLVDFAEAENWLKKVFLLLRHDEHRCWESNAYQAQAYLDFLEDNHERCIERCKRSVELARKFHKPLAAAGAEFLAAESYFALANRDMAIEYCKSAIKVFSRYTDSRSHDQSLFAMGKLYKYREKFAEARSQFLFCADLRGKMGALDGQANALVEVGGVDLFLGKVRDATESLERAVQLYEHIGNKIGLLKGLNLYAESLRIVGAYEDAGKALDRARELAETAGKRVGISESAFVRAKISLDQGDLVTAEELIRRAFPKKPSLARTLLKALDFWCNFYRDRGDFQRFLEHSEEGLKVAAAHNLPLYGARFQEQLALMTLRLGNFEEAAIHADTLAESAQRHNLPLSRGRSLMVKGRVYAKNGKHEDAWSHFRDAERVFASEGSERDLVQLYYEYGISLLEVEDFAQAFMLLQEGLYLSKKLQLAVWRCRFMVARGELELAAPEGRRKKALSHLRLALEQAKAGSYTHLQCKIEFTLEKLKRVSL